MGTVANQMLHDPGLFEIIESTRAIKRLHPEPVPLELLRRVLHAGTQGPSGLNTQPWEFLVVRETAPKRFVQERYLHHCRALFQESLDAMANEDTPHARMLRTVFHLAEHLHEVPVLLFACGHRDWPFWVAEEDRVGAAPPPYGSIFPSVQNMLLACRALGLGASVTTIHRTFEDELAAYFGVPDEVSMVALLPIGFPRGRFGPVTRKPAEALTHFEHWRNDAPQEEQ